MNLDNSPTPDIDPEDEFSDYFDTGDEESTEQEYLESIASRLEEENEYLPEIIQSELDDYISRKKLNHETAEVLTDMITEHMSCFLILGYDYEGNSITIQNSNTQKDVDSLNTLIHKYIFTHATNMGKA